MFNQTITAKKSLPSIKEYDSLSYNPFKLDNGNNDFVTHYTRPKPKEGFTYVEGIKGEGIIEEKNELVTKDLTIFVKFFKGSFDVIRKLSNPAMNIMYYIVENLKDNNDFVFLPIKNVLVDCGYHEDSRILYYTGMRELLAEKIIAPKTSAIKHEYWINANLFFRGNRVELFKQERKTF